MEIPIQANDNSDKSSACDASGIASLTISVHCCQPTTRVLSLTISVIPTLSWFFGYRTERVTSVGAIPLRSSLTTSHLISARSLSSRTMVAWDSLRSKCSSSSITIVKKSALSFCWPVVTTTPLLYLLDNASTPRSTINGCLFYWCLDNASELQQQTLYLWLKDQAGFCQLREQLIGLNS